jgi:hypothetical protein
MDRLAEMRNEALKEYYLRWPVIRQTVKRARSPRVMANYFRFGMTQLADLFA